MQRDLSVRYSGWRVKLTTHPPSNAEVKNRRVYISTLPKSS
jgi:hypothetical protein